MRAMNLPLSPPIAPMLAKRVDALPVAEEGWLFEPKWDGFRALAFRDGDELYLQSRDKKPLARYFPELCEVLRAALPPRCVVDGEIVIASDDGLDFSALQMRLHPAASRVEKLAAQMPSSFVAWDLLADGDDDLQSTPFEARRNRLCAALGDLSGHPHVHVTPATTDRALAADWFDRFEGAGLDGVMAKPIDGTYQPGKRAMLKVKHKRTVDCVVAGFRWHKNGAGTKVGSLLLGLFDGDGTLHHVGVAASFTDKRRRELVDELAPLREDAAVDHPWQRMLGDVDWQRVPGGGSRWSQGKSLAWEPLRPLLVVEVSYDHLQGSRFRHTAHFVRWRPDKPPAECTYDQCDVAVPYELGKIFNR